MVDYSNIPRDSRRVPLETRVQFKFDRFSGFISEYSANISPGGMFIRTRAPQPHGTVLDVEFRLGDGFELIKGRAEVVWVRTEDEGPTRPAGMGLRFQELAPGSKELIYRIVDEHIAQGGTPFDVTKRPPDPIPVLGAAAGLAGAPRPVPPPSQPLPPPFAPGRDWPPAMPPGTAKGDVFDLPDLEPLSPVAPIRRDPDLEPDAAWAPSPLEEPAADPYPAREPFPDLFEPPAPAEPPASAPAPMFASTYGAGAASAKAKPRRLLPLVALAAVLLLAVGAYLFQDTLMELAGLGGEDEIAQAAPPARRRPAPRPQAPAAPGPETQPVAAEPAATAAPPQEETVLEESPAPVAPAAPPPAPAPAPAADTGPLLGRVERITWEEVPGGTDVILWGDGAIRSEAYSRTRIDGNPPRELIRLSGIRQPFGQARIVAGSKELLQVRTGYHPGNQLHVVLDLANPAVQVQGVEEGPKQLRVRLRRQ